MSAWRALLTFPVFGALCYASNLEVTVSAEGPVAVGTPVTVTARGTSQTPDLNRWYRFRVRKSGEEAFRIVRDFGPKSELEWTEYVETATEIEVTLEERPARERTVEVVRVEFVPAVEPGGGPVLLPTRHPLVRLYSAPPCEAGLAMWVRFTSPEGYRQQTPAQECDGVHTMNFLLAGARVQSSYTVQHELSDESSGPELVWDTGWVDIDLPVDTVLDPAQNAPAQGVLLQSTVMAQPLATDLEGNVVWYYPDTISVLTRARRGGYFLGIFQNLFGLPRHQIVREFDLTGLTVLETNAGRVNDQLTAMGKRTITGFHHEALRLANGNMLVLAGVEQLLSDVQGPGKVDVLGDMIIVLDPELNVVWTWDTFDHLDVRRKATMDDVCTPGACPPTYLARTANDWTHGNAVQETPDGQLLYSSRSQDWVIKIAYDGGQGDGHVIWRLGKDGDFTMLGSEDQPWFSHQHDSHFLPGSTTQMLVFDNGNLRHDRDESARSRGQWIEIDEQARTAKLLLNADMGVYSFALGAAQMLGDGTFHFTPGFQMDGSGLAALNVDAAGSVLYRLHSSAPVYRSYRMRDLYSEPY